MAAEDALRRQRNLLYQVSRHEAASNVALVEGRHAELSQRLKEEGEKLCGNQPVRRVHHANAIEQASRRWREGRVVKF